MPPPPTARILDHFRDLEDPRVSPATRHQLLDIVTIAVCAVICGADSWVEVVSFGNAKRAWLDTFLALPYGIPSHDTFGRVFAALAGGAELIGGLLLMTGLATPIAAAFTNSRRGVSGIVSHVWRQNASRQLPSPSAGPSADAEPHLVWRRRSHVSTDHGDVRLLPRQPFRFNPHSAALGHAA